MSFLRIIFTNKTLFFVFLGALFSIFYFIIAIIAAFSSNAIILWGQCFSAIPSALILWISFYILLQNEKKNIDFEFGFGKLEASIQIIRSSMMLLYATIMIPLVIHRFTHPIEIKNITIAMVSYSSFIFVNFYLFWSFRRLSLEYKTPLIQYQKKYYLQSILINLLVLIPLAQTIILPTHQKLAMMTDTFMALLICFTSVYISFGEGKRAAFELFDKALEENLQLIILRFLAKHFDSYEQYHGQRTRQAAGIKYIDLFLEFDNNKTMGAVLLLSKAIKKDIEEAIPNSQVCIIPTRSKTVDLYKIRTLIS